MALDNSVVAFYGTAAGCIRYRMAATDYAYANQRPDSAKWSLNAQGPITDDPSYATLPLVVNMATATFPPPTWVPDPAHPGNLIAVR
jgi:hypothetical protein